MIIEITNQNSRDSPSYIMQIVPSNCVILLKVSRYAAVIRASRRLCVSILQPQVFKC